MWLCLGQYEQVWGKYKQCWAGMGKVQPYVTSYESGMIRYEQLLDRYDQVWAGITRYEQIWDWYD